jgi:hypothetical protein
MAGSINDMSVTDGIQRFEGVPEFRWNNGATRVNNPGDITWSQASTLWATIGANVRQAAVPPTENAPEKLRLISAGGRWM